MLSSSQYEPEEKLKRKSKQQKVEGKEKKVLEEETQTQTKTISCTQLFKRRSKGIVIKDSAVEKDLVAALAKPIKSLLPRDKRSQLFPLKLIKMLCPS